MLQEMELPPREGGKIFVAKAQGGGGVVVTVDAVKHVVSVDKASDNWTIRIADGIGLSGSAGGDKGNTIEAKVSPDQNIVAVADPQTAELALFAAAIPPQDDASKLKPKPAPRIVPS